MATASYTDPSFAGLRAPAQDATDMIDILDNPKIGSFTVAPMVDQPEHAVRRAIDSFLADRSPSDLVLIYLSCHGVLDPRGRLYFATTDTTRTRLSSTAIESAWLLDRLEECRARQQILILDCCFSGAFAGAKGANPGSESELDLQRRLIGAGRGRVVLTASRAGEYSYEGEPLPGAAGRSVFTAALVDGIRSGEADCDRDGYISVEDAFIFASDRVKAADGDQSPQRWLYGAEGQLILARNPQGIPVTPAELPQALRMSLESPYANVRRGGVTELGEWLASTNPDQVLAALQKLQDIAAHDIPSVAATAHDLLNQAKDTPTHLPTARTLHRTEKPAHSTEHLPPSSGVPCHCLRTIEHVTRRTFGNLGLSRVLAVAFSPNGQILATGSNDKTIRMWDIATGQLARPPLTNLTGVEYEVAFSPNGQILATGSGSLTNKARLWDTATGQQIGRPLTGHIDSVQAVAFSPNGQILATGSRDKTIRMWDTATGQQIGRPLTGHTGWVEAVAFSPNGQILATGSWDKTIRMWDTATGQQIGQPLTGHTGWVSTVAFSPNGQILATGGLGNTIRMWDTATGQQIGQPLTGHTGWVSTVAFSPNGQILATGSRDKTIRMWDTATGQQIGQPLTGHTKRVPTMAFSPNGQILATGSWDNSIRIWSEPPAPHM